VSVTLFKEVGYSLSGLLEDIEMGEIGLPEMQRPFVWPNAKVRDLFDSMYRGFPIGSLLFWVNGFSEVHHQIGADKKQKTPRLLIVDGQQRLTSLYAVLRGKEVVRKDYSKERIRIAFMPKAGRFEVTDAAIKRDPEFIPDISQLWSAGGSRKSFLKGFVTRLRKHREVTDAEEDALWDAIDQLYELQNYPFTVLELSANMPEEEVSHVFVRINSTGTQLNQADFILTLMSVFWDEGRTQLESFCRAARQPGPGSPYNHFIQPDPDQLLRVTVALGFRRARLQHVYSLLRGKNLETEEFSEAMRDKQFATLRDAQAYTLDLQSWHDFLKVLLRAGFRSSDMIASQVGLLYNYALFLIGKRDYGVDDYALRNLIARWFFISSLTRRYTTSPETAMEQDLAHLREVKDASGFVEVLDRIMEDSLPDDYWAITLPNELATSAPRSPALLAYYAALNLLDANVLFSKVKVGELLDPAFKSKRAAIERHHLFPKGYLAKQGITAVRDTNQIANFALVEWGDNADIGDKAPAEYLPGYTERLTEAELARMYYWHALPISWEGMDYDALLATRRRLLAQVIKDGFATLKG